MNPYLPLPVKIKKIIVENDLKDIKSLEIGFENKDDEEQFRWLPGQFAQLSVAGAGEAPFGLASSPTEKDYLLFTIKRTGVVTRELHNAEEGRVLGMRGPFGEPYPLDKMQGKPVVIVGGGFAFTTLRATIRYLLDNRDKFGEITVIYGARNPGELIYKSELKEWEQSKDIDLHITVDEGDEHWAGRVGLVPSVLKEVAPSSKDTYAIVCGPPIMLKFTFPVLTELGFAHDRMITSLEMRMKCGIGLCGRCNIGSKYVCKDGPVFTYEQLENMPNEY